MPMDNIATPAVRDRKPRKQWARTWRMQLDLPDGKHSHGPRKLAAVEAALGSFG